MKITEKENENSSLTKESPVECVVLLTKKTGEAQPVKAKAIKKPTPKSAGKFRSKK